MVINLAISQAQETQVFYHTHELENRKRSFRMESLGADYQAAGLDLAENTNTKAVEVKRYRQVMESMVLPVVKDESKPWLLVI